MMKKEKRPSREAKGAYSKTNTAYSTGFDRSRLPDPVSYYSDMAGLEFRERRGKWRTTRCEFHGGSDSLRVNTETGAFVCMADCGARGGDVIAYHMAARGLGFADAARELGCWVEGAAPRTRPTPLSARDAIQLLAAEANLVAVAAGNIAYGVVLADADMDRLLIAAGRILKIGGMFA